MKNKKQNISPPSKKKKQIEREFTLQNHLEFKANSWVLYKGTRIIKEITTFEIKITKCPLMDRDDGADIIYFAIGFCSPSFNGNVLAWNEKIWSYGSGTSYSIFNKSSLTIGQVIKVNDVITMSVDIKKGEMSLKINENDHGVVFTEVEKDLCFAVCVRCNLEIELLNLKGLDIIDLWKERKSIDINFNFY